MAPRSPRPAPAGRAAPRPGETARTRGLPGPRAPARAAPPWWPWTPVATRAPRRCARRQRPHRPPPPSAGRTARSPAGRARRPPGTGPGRSCARRWRSSPRSPRLEARQVLHHQAAVGLGVEVRLDQLRRGGDREIHGLAPQIEDRLVLLTVDLLARPVEQLLVLLAWLGEQRGPLLLGHRAGLRDELLRLGARRRDQALRLGDERRRLLA